MDFTSDAPLDDISGLAVSFVTNSETSPSSIQEQQQQLLTLELPSPVPSVITEKANGQKRKITGSPISSNGNGVSKMEAAEANPEQQLIANGVDQVEQNNISPNADEP